MDTLLSGLAGLAGGLFGYFGQKKTNELNKEINQMNNEFNERMLNKQLAFQEDMWNKTNEYNTASAQRRRLEEAGLNPYLMMSGGNAGTATSQSGGSASAASPVPMQNAASSALQGATALGDFVNSIGLTQASIAKQEAETQGLEIQNDFAVAREKASLANLWARTGNEQALKDLRRLQYQFDFDTFENRKAGFEIQNRLNEQRITSLRAQEALTWLQGEEQYIKNAYLPTQQMMDFVTSLYEQQKSQALTKESIARAYKARCEANGIKISNRVANETAGLLIQRINSDNYEQWKYNKAYDGTNRGYKQYQLDTSRFHNINSSTIANYAGIGIDLSSELRNWIYGNPANDIIDSLDEYDENGKRVHSTRRKREYNPRKFWRGK